MTQEIQSTPLDLSALVGSRICHDLISPLGAIANGVELMALTGAEQTPEMLLIAENVEAANARIKFFRLAYGTAGADQLVRQSELNAIFSALSRSGRITFDWRGTNDPLRQRTQFALLSVQCLETALPFGGTISVSHHEGQFTVTGRSERLRHDPALWAMLTDETAVTKVRPSDVHFFLTAQMRAEHQIALDIEVSDAEIKMTF